MGMNDLPFITHAPEQERLETPIVNLALILFDQGLDLNVDDSPRKVAFDMRLDIGKVQLEVIQRITFGLYVVSNEIRQSFVLPTALDVTGAGEVEIVLAKRLTVSLFPAFFNRIYYCDEFRGIVFLRGNVLRQKR